LDAGEDFGFAGALVPFVAGEEGSVDGVAVEERAGVAGVFGQDARAGAEDAEGAEGDVFEVADGGADEVETGRE
jgi:hypothetical protein